jgi:hypothetical protein
MVRVKFIKIMMKNDGKMMFKIGAYKLSKIGVKNHQKSMLKITPKK